MACSSVRAPTRYTRVPPVDSTTGASSPRRLSGAVFVSAHCCMRVTPSKMLVPKPPCEKPDCCGIGCPCV
eukprot:3247637-Prymnesium_polylepis.1